MTLGVPGGTALQVAASINWTAVGVFIAILTSTAGGTYAIGRMQEASNQREADVDDNADELEQVTTELSDLETAVVSLTQSFSRVVDELERNREDIRQQHKVVHDQLIGDDETCGDETCVFCHPENAYSDVQVGDPVPEEVAEQFDTWDKSVFTSDSPTDPFGSDD